MKKAIFFIFIINLLSAFINVYPNSPIDSLENLLKTADDGNKLEIYSDICKYYLNIDPTLALEYAEKELEFAKETGNSEDEVTALINIGACYSSLYNYDNVLNYNLIALNLSENIKFTKGIILSNNNIGTVYNELSNYEKALEYYLKNYNYFIENKLDTVSDYYFYFAICLNNIGQIYSDLGDLPKSIEYLNKSIEIHKNFDDNSLIIPTLINIGVSYLELRNYEMAEKKLLEAEEISRQGLINSNLAGALLNLGLLYTEMAEFELSLKYLEEGIKISAETQSGKLLSYGNYYLSLYYEKQKMFDSALVYHKKFKIIADSLFNEDLNFKIANMQVRYETEKKNNEIEIQKNTIFRKNITIAMLIFAFLAISILMILFLIQYRDKKIAYDKIVQQNLKQLRKEKELKKNQEEQIIAENKEFIEKDKYLSSRFLSFIEQFEQQKPYLDSQITIETLAKQFDTNRTYLSQLINNNTKLNFNNFINKYRIEFALNMLSEPKYYNLSIEGIAQSAGFHSKSTFNNAFKNLIGITPSYFRDSIKVKVN
jgi:tetratricopeptide (TPR) repeat protein